MPGASVVPEIVVTSTGHKAGQWSRGKVSDGLRQNQEGYWSSILGLLEDNGARVKMCGAIVASWRLGLDASTVSPHTDAPAGTVSHHISFYHHLKSRIS